MNSQISYDYESVYSPVVKCTTRYLSFRRQIKEAHRGCTIVIKDSRELTAQLQRSSWRVDFDTLFSDLADWIFQFERQKTEHLRIQCPLCYGEEVCFCGETSHGWYESHYFAPMTCPECLGSGVINE